MTHFGGDATFNRGVIGMPRQIRNLGTGGWAHIILRGINREALFYDEEDCNRFFSTLDRFQRETSFELAAVCLMSTHVHLLMEPGESTHAQIIKKVAVSYASYYNGKYERVGHVFQDRFRSEPVTDERYLLTVARYIWLNPQKAGICAAGEYPYTRIQFDGILSEYFPTRDDLRAFLDADNDDRCLEFDSTNRLSDAEALDVLRSISGCSNPQMLQDLVKTERDEEILRLKRSGLSVRQIARLTGINRNTIQRI